jgi:hypothetical protein
MHPKTTDERIIEMMKRAYATTAGLIRLAFRS